MQAYCVACRNMTEMLKPRTVQTENGKPVRQGICQKCGAKTYRIAKS